MVLSNQIIDSTEKLDLKPFFVLLDLIDTLKLNSERYRIENLAFPILNALNSWKNTGQFSMKFELEDAILLLDRLNFNTEAVKTDLDSKKAADP